jgi:hypothetical protein
MNKGGLWRLIVVAVLVGFFSHVTGIIGGLLGFVATDYNEVTQCLVWVANVLLCLIIFGGIALLILRKRKHYFFGEPSSMKIKYIVGTFCFAYVISAIIVIIGKGRFDITYVTTLIVVEFLIGLVGGLVTWLTKQPKKVEEVSMQARTQEQSLPINEPLKQKSNVKKKKKDKKKRK